MACHQGFTCLISASFLTIVANLNAIYQAAPALQQPALQAWQGKPGNTAATQQALLERARLNHLAMPGEYSPDMGSP